MFTFLKIIFITFVVLYLAGLLGRWFLRRWIMKKQEEFTRRFDGQGGATFRQYTWSSRQGYDRQPPKQEGEIKVQRTARQGKKVRGQIGEYVEYEEVEVEETRTDD